MSSNTVPLNLPDEMMESIRAAAEKLDGIISMQDMIRMSIREGLPTVVQKLKPDDSHLKPLTREEAAVLWGPSDDPHDQEFDALSAHMGKLAQSPPEE